MLEMLAISQSSGGAPQPPDDTGPGPTTLLYSYERNSNQMAGYYGETPSASLITGAALASMMSFSAGTVGTDSGWLKFVCDGKILFIAKTPFRYNISYNNLDIRAMTQGTTTITIGSYQYKIRLMQGQTVDNDPSKVTTGSEFNRLIYSVWEDVPVSESEVSDSTKWAAYTTANLGFGTGTGSNTLCKEVFYTTTSPGLSRVCRGRVSYSAIIGQNYNTAVTSIGWRPVLELVGQV